MLSGAEAAGDQGITEKQADETAQVAESPAEPGDLPHVLGPGDFGQKARYEVLTAGEGEVGHHKNRGRQEDLPGLNHGQQGREQHAGEVRAKQETLLEGREVRDGADQRRAQQDQSLGNKIGKRPVEIRSRPAAGNNLNEVDAENNGDNDRRE